MGGTNIIDLGRAPQCIQTWTQETVQKAIESEGESESETRLSDGVMNDNARNNRGCTKAIYSLVNPRNAVRDPLETQV